MLVITRRIVFSVANDTSGSLSRVRLVPVDVERVVSAESVFRDAVSGHVVSIRVRGVVRRRGEWVAGVVGVERRVGGFYVMRG